LISKDDDSSSVNKEENEPMQVKITKIDLKIIFLFEDKR
jgi:hypothetical protein